MRFELLAYAGMFIIMVTSMNLLVNPNRRSSIIVLGVQYLAVFFLVIQAWSVGLSSIKLIAGWMAAAILGLSEMGIKEREEQTERTSGRLFRVFSGILIWILVFTITPGVSNWLPLPYVFIWSSLILIGLGIFQMAMSSNPLRIILGLFSTFSGFEIIYSAVENSVLVAGLLAVVTLGIAMVGAYLIIAPSLEKIE
jgi:hypothetical protein